MKIASKVLPILLFSVSIAVGENASRFEGTWLVDTGAEQRSSDTGPVFRAFRLSNCGQGIRQEMIIEREPEHPGRLVFCFPAFPASSHGRVEGKPIATSSYWDGGKLVLLWTESGRKQDAMRSVLTLSQDSKTLVDSVFLGTSAKAPAQVVVLRRVKALPFPSSASSARN